MANSTQKALDLAYLIQEELALRLGAAGANITGGVASVTFDTDGCPLIQVGTSGAGNKGGLIKVIATPWPNAKDILGNSAIQYGPQTIMLATETGGVAGTDVNDPAVLLPMLSVCTLKGCRFEWYKSANGVAPVVGTLVAGNLKAAFESTLQYPLISSQ